MPLNCGAQVPGGVLVQVAWSFIAKSSFPIEHLPYPQSVVGLNEFIRTKDQRLSIFRSRAPGQQGAAPLQLGKGLFPWGRFPSYYYTIISTVLAECCEKLNLWVLRRAVLTCE